MRVTRANQLFVNILQQVSHQLGSSCSTQILLPPQALANVSTRSLKIYENVVILACCVSLK